MLRNSITYAVSGEPAAISEYKSIDGSVTGTYTGTAEENQDGMPSVYIGSNVKYRVYIETGTKTIPAVHYLSNAVQENTEKYKRVTETMLSQIE